MHGPHGAHIYAQCCIGAQKCSQKRFATLQTAVFKAFTATHFTTVRAFFALTRTSLPNAMRLPAFVAGLWRVLIMATPGMVNFPVPFTSFVATSARASKTLAISDLFESHASAKASAIPLLGIAFTPFMAFIPFMDFIASM